MRENQRHGEDHRQGQDPEQDQGGAACLSQPFGLAHGKAARAVDQGHCNVGDQGDLKKLDENRANHLERADHFAEKEAGRDA